LHLLDHLLRRGTVLLGTRGAKIGKDESKGQNGRRGPRGKHSSSSLQEVENEWAEMLHGPYFARISLIRVIASLTACSGLMPWETTRCTALPQTFSDETRA
jgi:hypothetical protein